MPGNHLKPVQPGDPFPAKEQNIIRRQLNALMNVGDDQSVISTGAGTFRAGRGKGSDHTIVTIRNNTGSDLTDIPSVVGLGDVERNPTDDEGTEHRTPIIKGEEPSSDYSGKFGIVLGKVEKDDTQTAVIAGWAWCKVDVTDEDHEYADVKDSDTSKLESGSSGAQIIWKESGTGTKWALIFLGGSGGGLSSDEIQDLIDCSVCNCSFIEVGASDCLGTNESAAVYVVDDLGVFGTEVTLEEDESCEFISDDLEYDCS